MNKPATNDRPTSHMVAVWSGCSLYLTFSDLGEVSRKPHNDNNEAYK